MQATLALSTCWNSYRHTDGYEMLQEIAGLGFTHAELSHGIRISLVPGIIRAVEENLIQISTTHNFCPLPVGLMHPAPNHFEPTSTNPHERAQWIRYTHESIDFAAQMKARLIVLHLGSARFFWNNPERKLDRFIDSHANLPTDSSEYQSVLQKSLKRLREKTPKYYDNMLDCLSQVIPHAAEKNILLGLENREGFNEIPADDAFPALFDALPQPNTCRAWHDVGHGNLKEYLGTMNQREFLQQLSPRLAGFHLHDVSTEGDDHQPIGSGRINFDMIASFFRPDHLFTLELSPRTSTDDVRLSKTRIESLLSQSHS